MASSSKQGEINKQIVSQFFELLGRHDTERMEQLLVSSTQYSFHPSGMPPLDWNGHKQLLASITGAFPDLHHDIRSEEHTSELQSRQYLVCRLLLEKKNNETIYPS